MTFVKKPMADIYRFLTIFITHTQFAEFIIFLAYKQTRYFKVQHPIYIAYVQFQTMIFAVNNKIVGLHQNQRSFDAYPIPVPTIQITLKKDPK